MASEHRDIGEKRLRYFFETVSTGSVRAAADLLDVEPSLVTRQIQALEKDLECKLFERRGRNIFPTEAASYVMDHCRERWSSENTLFSRLSELRGLQRGEIKVVAGEGFLSELSQALSFDFCQKYPNINVTLEQSSSDEAVRRVAQDQAHIGIAYCAPSDSAVRVIKTRRLPMSVIVWPGHPLTKKKGALVLKDVVPYPLALLQDGFGVRKLLRAAEIAEQIELHPVMTSNSLASLKNHVKARMGITFLSKRGVEQEETRGEIVSLPIDNAILQSGEIQLIVRSDRAASAALTKLQRLLSDMRLFDKTDRNM